MEKFREGGQFFGFTLKGGLDKFLPKVKFLHGVPCPSPPLRPKIGVLSSKS